MKLNSIENVDMKRRFRDELLRLESMLHFPEEVAFCFGKVEYELFYNILPVHYIRQGVVFIIFYYLNYWRMNSSLLGMTILSFNVSNFCTKLLIIRINKIIAVTLDLCNGEDRCQGKPTNNINDNNDETITVNELIQRFHEVSSWITQLIISQPTHEMR